MGFMNGKFYIYVSKEGIYTLKGVELELFTRHTGNVCLNSTIEIDKENNLMILANRDFKGILKILNSEAEEMYVSIINDQEYPIQHRYVKNCQVLVLTNNGRIFCIEYNFEKKISKILNVVKIDVDMKYNSESVRCFCFDDLFGRVYVNITTRRDNNDERMPEKTEKILVYSLKSGKCVKEFLYGDDDEVDIQNLEILDYGDKRRFIIGVNSDTYSKIMFFAEGEGGEFKEQPRLRRSTHIIYPKKIVNFGQFLVISSSEGAFTLVYLSPLRKDYLKNKFFSLKIYG